MLKKATYYLPCTYDRLDQYYQLDDCSKDDLLGFFNVLFNKFNIKEFKDLNNISESYLEKIYGNIESIDIVGGCFGIMGFYIQGFYGNHFPKNCRGVSKQKAKLRFEWLKDQIENYDMYKLIETI